MSKQPGTMTAAEYQARHQKPQEGQKRPKYGAKRTEVGDLSFDSKKEAGRWQELQTQERAGEITRLQRQVPFALTVAGVLIGRYVADFVYRDKAGQRVVEDAKGLATDFYKWKKKHMEAEHGIIIKEV